MREIQRKIVSAIIISKDNKFLMGKKDPAKGGVYSDCWHIPGGGVDENETFEEAIKREVMEEVGIDISPYNLEPIKFVGSGSAEKTLKTGEKVLCHMEFNRFEIRIEDKLAEEITIRPSDDLVEMRWIDAEGLPYIKQIPGGKEFFAQAGYING
jgi:8-oxo-dGTP pyrophosphatase MutT (NUDIX family)